MPHPLDRLLSRLPAPVAWPAVVAAPAALAAQEWLESPSRRALLLGGAALLSLLFGCGAPAPVARAADLGPPLAAAVACVEPEAPVSALAADDPCALALGDSDGPFGDEACPPEDEEPDDASDLGPGVLLDEGG